MSVILETTIGDLVIDLFTDERPRACLNFLKLCKIKFYNYSLFHVVQKNFLAQTGDPTGAGRGGESIFRRLYGDQATFFEAETKPRIKHIKKGTVSMVNNGNDMHGSQFFITLGENLDYLDGQHTVFGEVAEGFEILDKLNEIICDDNHRPYQDVRITHTVILDDPYDDPAGLKVPDRSPEPTKEQLDSGRIGADEEIDDTKGKTMEEVEEMIEEREFKAGAQILEMVGDIPDADIKPPDNVLFVCKLNPVTTDEDLEIIFSRFGPVKCCEIIKDSVSQESLQYAFVEYENPEDCERAYFKMDNVLIDDRRIHVDFSQSVSKLAYSKPGSKPVYELKDKKETKPKLKIKDSSKKDKYDLVFGEGDSDRSGSQDEKKISSKKHKKDDYRKRRRTSSEEQSPENTRRHGNSEKRSGGNRHGNQTSDDSGEPRVEQNKRDRKRGKDKVLRDKEERSTDKVQRSRNSDDSDDRSYSDKRDKKGYLREHEDRDGNRRSEDRYSRKNRDKTRDRGKHDLEDRHREKERKRDRSSEDRYSRDNKDHSRDKKGHRGNGGYSRDNRGDDRRKEKSRRDRGSSSRDNSESEDEHRRKKRRKDEKEKQDRKKKKTYRHDSSGSSS